MHTSRIPTLMVAVLLFGAVLTPAAAQVVQTIDPTNPPPGTYSYAVKFVCGFQDSNTGLVLGPNGYIPFGEPSVKAGNYATEINIYNPGNDAEVRKKVLLLVDEGRPVGREPKFVEPVAFDEIALPSCSATMDDCNRINELVPALSPFNLRIGYLVVTSREPLDVTAVYTAELCSDWTITGAGRMCSTPFGINGVSPFSSALSIDVEQVDAKFLPD